jgi:hypothetical protein
MNTETKTCNICHETKLLKQFPKNKEGKDGHKNFCYTCQRKKPYHKAWCKKYYQKNKKAFHNRITKYKNAVREWVEEYKAKSKCCVCGENHPATLDFHHKDPTQKDFSISRGGHSIRSLKKVKEEVAKCEIICSNCHRKLHWKKDGPKEGTILLTGVVRSTNLIRPLLPQEQQAQP